MEQRPLFADLPDLILTCLHFNNDVEAVLENFQQINPAPEDFLSPHDPVVAACLGRHFQLAAVLIDKGFGRVTHDTVSLVEGELGHMMKVWVQEIQDGNLHASWQEKNLHVFDSKWLQFLEYKTALNTINLSSNMLLNIPQQLLWGLPGLQNLDISKNKITLIPGPLNADQLKQSSLRDFDMSSNEIHYVPLEIFQLPKIERLWMQRNEITSLDPADNLSRLTIVQGLHEEWQCRKLRELELSRNRLDSLPSEIKGAIGLTTLRLNNNKLKTLPDCWPCPMKDIDASMNNICDLGNMHDHWELTLETLVLRNNRLKTFPATACSLVALNVLNLQDNNIESLPDPKCCKIYRLQVLNLAGNQLTNNYEQPVANTLKPEEYTFFKSLKNGLQHLDLANNDLTVVPPSVCELRHLFRLDLRGNKNLNSLPYELAKLKNLVELQIDAHFLTKQPEVKEAIANSKSKRGLTETILLTLKHGLYNSIPYRGMKMIVVGSAKSGKTTLLKSLTQARDFAKEDIPVNVYTWDLCDPRQSILSHSTSDMVKFTVWDLKGGDIYDIIQPCLYTDKCLFLLVWDAKDGPDTVEQLHSWLVEIKRKAPESGVILVGTHRDKLKQKIIDEVRAQIQSEFETYMGSFCLVSGNKGATPLGPISFTTSMKDGIDDLKHLIYRHATAMTGTYTGVSKKRTLPIIGRKVPRAFLDLKKILEKRYRLPLKMLFTLDHLSKSPLKQATESFTKEDIHESLDFLTECGTIVPIKIRSGRQLNILDPNWLIRMQCQVTEVESRFVHDGRVSIETLANFCKECGLRKQLNDYLDLVEQLEIAVRVDMERHWFWIPAILPLQKAGIAPPIKNWPILRRYFKLPYILPRFWIRLVSRLVISFKHLSQSNQPSDNSSGRPFTRQVSLWGTSSEGSQLSSASNTSQSSSDDMSQETSSRHTSQWMPSFREASHALPSTDTHPSNIQLTQSWQTAYFMTRSNRNLLEGLNLQIEGIVYWQEGVLVTHRTGRVLVESHQFSDRKPGIRVQIHCEGRKFQEMGFIVDHIESLLKDWYPEKGSHSGVVRLIPCPKCPDEEVFCRNFEDLIVSATYDIQKEVTFWCEQHTFPLKDLLPDVFLTDLKVDVLEQSQLPNVSFSEEHKLGSGGYGSVYRGNFDGEDVAVKTLVQSHISLQPNARVSKLSESQNSSWVESFFMFRSEVGMLSQLNHQNIIKMIGWACIQTLSFGMEIAPEGDLSSVLEKEYQNFKERNPQRFIHDVVLERDLTYKILAQTVSAVCYLHDNDLIYSDLKTNNVLVFSLDINDPINIKLADYGISLQLIGIGARGGMGTVGFSAPETIRKDIFDTKADWYSFSMLIYHILSGRWPFSDLEHASKIEAATLEGTRPDFNFGTCKQTPTMPALVDVMESCWRDSPQDRPEGKEIMNSMADVSFLCLHKVIPLDQAVVYRIYTSTDTDSDSDSECKPYLLHIWSGIRRSDSVVFKRKDLADTQELEGVVRPLEINIRGTSNIKCIARHKSLHFIATLFDGIHVYEIRHIDKYPEFQRKGNPVATAQPVESMCYQQFKQTTNGRLFVGYQKRQLQIFIREDAGNWTTPTTHLIDTAGDHPCSSMRLVADDTQLWIACGNKIFVADVTNPQTIAFVDSIQVVSQDKVNIAGMVYQQKHIWCFINSSLASMVVQYNENKECIGRLVVDMSGNVKVRDLRDDSAIGGEESLNGDDEFDVHSDLIQSILVVDDTLWIGTISGDIIVVNVTSGNTYGDVLGVLRVHSCLGKSGSSVKHMVLCGPDRVVACQMIKGCERVQDKDDNSGHLQVSTSRYQLVVWDRWDAGKFQWFEKVQQGLKI